MRLKQSIAVMVLLLLALAPVSFAQFTSNAKVMEKSTSQLDIYFAGALDTTGGTYASINSKDFALADYDASTNYTFFYKFTSAKGSPKVTVYLQGSEDNSTFTNIDTLCTGITAETQAYATFDMNKIRAKYYRLNIKQEDLGRDDATFICKIRACKRD